VVSGDSLRLLSVIEYRRLSTVGYFPIDFQIPFRVFRCELDKSKFRVYADMLIHISEDGRKLFQTDRLALCRAREGAAQQTCG
jgi:hypothetical protein